MKKIRWKSSNDMRYKYNKILNYLLSLMIQPDNIRMQTIERKISTYSSFYIIIRSKNMTTSIPDIQANQ